MSPTLASPPSRPSIGVLIACARIGSAVTAKPAAMHAATKPRRSTCTSGSRLLRLWSFRSLRQSSIPLSPLLDTWDTVRGRGLFHPQLAVAIAAGEMVVDHAGRLHEGVADGRADEAEAALLQVLAHRVRFGGARRDVVALAPVLDRLAADELPDVAVERAELLLHGEKRLRVAHGAFDLQAVAHDAFVLHQERLTGSGEARDLGRIKSGKGAPVVRALFQDRRPAQPGLRAFQRDELEQHAVVVHRHAPFLVVVGDVQRAGGPATA